MIRGRGLAAAVALFCAAAAAGCGLGPGKSTGDVGLLVTHDYGAETAIGPEELDARESDTVLRLLDGKADITTRYGDNFVQSIDGVEGKEQGGRRYDWFFYVNGVEAGRGAGDFQPGAGDRIWWDYHDWTAAMRVPAVVGSYPEPFLHGYEGRDYPTRIDCLGDRAPCDVVAANLKKEGVEAGVVEASDASAADSQPGPALRILVGPWSVVGADRAAAQLADGPEQSGVFARFQGKGRGATLVGLGEDGDAATGRFAGDTGLVAALRYQDQPPTWVVTGTGPAGVAAAAKAFTAQQMAGHYALIAQPPAATAAAPTPVPVADGPQ